MKEDDCQQEPRQGASGGDANSISVNPYYKTDSNLHVCNATLRNAGLNGLGGITTDYDNEARSNPPDIGADESDDPLPMVDLGNDTAFCGY